MVDFDQESPLDFKEERKSENPKGKRLMKVIRKVERFVKGFFSEGDEKHWRRDIDDW